MNSTSNPRTHPEPLNAPCLLTEKQLPTGAAPDPTHDGSYVYSKKPGFERWCPGLVAEHLGEAVLNGTVYSDHADVAQACLDSCGDGCNQVSMVTTAWSDVVGAAIENPSPPPQPPSPPSPPLPSSPPMPPVSPLAAPGERFRDWTPDGYEFATADDDGFYSITCRASACDGMQPLPVYRGEYLPTHQLAISMFNEGRLDGAICPWECTPTLEAHALSASDLSAFEAGLGVGGLHFPGTEAGDGQGFSAFEAHTDTTMRPTIGSTGLDAGTAMTRTACEALVLEHTTGKYGALVHGTLAVWHRRHAGGAGSPRGDCLVFRAVRDPLQMQLWTSFAAHARHVVDLPHFVPPEVQASRNIDGSHACALDSAACLMWAEFNAATYTCKPEHDLGNVLTPVRLLQNARDLDVLYPPPSKSSNARPIRPRGDPDPPSPLATPIVRRSAAARAARAAQPAAAAADAVHGRRDPGRGRHERAGGRRVLALARGRGRHGQHRLAAHRGPPQHARQRRLVPGRHDAQRAARPLQDV